MDDIKFISNVLHNVLRPQQEVVDQELFLLVDKLRSDARSRVETGFKLRLVHLVNSADVLHEHAD